MNLMNLDSDWGGVVLVFSGTVLSILGLLITRRLVNFDKLRASHDVGGYLLSVVGTLYAVLLGLVVVDAMGKFQLAREVTEREANALADVFMLARCLPSPKKEEVKKLCIDYAAQVINTEWADMQGGKYCPGAQYMAVSLMRNVLDTEPITENQKALYPILVHEANSVWQSRRARINMAVHGVAPAEWVTLIVGGVITVIFTFFFGLENLRLQIVMTSMVAILISLNIYLVLLFGYPFAGDLHISTDAFKIDQGIFDENVSSVQLDNAASH